MLVDIVFFGDKFYPLYLVAFGLELTGVIIFSLQKPIKPLKEDLDPIERI